MTCKRSAAPHRWYRSATLATSWLSIRPFVCAIVPTLHSCGYSCHPNYFVIIPALKIAANLKCCEIKVRSQKQQQHPCGYVANSAVSRNARMKSSRDEQLSACADGLLIELHRLSNFAYFINNKAVTQPIRQWVLQSFTSLWCSLTHENSFGHLYLQSILI